MEVVIDGVKYVPIVEVSNDSRMLDALDVRFSCFDFDNITIREYLRTLLTTLWNEGEGFSGKRPFGNSGWDYDIYKPLIEYGFIQGTLDEDGYINTLDEVTAKKFVKELITVAFYGVSE